MCNGEENGNIGILLVNKISSLTQTKIHTYRVDVAESAILTLEHVALTAVGASRE